MGIVDYSLELAHPDYRILIQDIIDELLDRYPRCPLREVRVYEEKPGDRSMGNADIPNVISLNGHWFSRHPDVMRQEANAKKRMPVGGGRMMLWHGPGMTGVEPSHVLHHEFWHVMQDVTPGWRQWAVARWEAATADPSLAPAGSAYCLGRQPDELWAEAGAAVSMGVADEALKAEIDRLVGLV